MWRRRSLLLALLAVSACGARAENTAKGELNAQSRTRLTALRDEAKFGPHMYPPLGYTGPPSAEYKAELSDAINDALDAILAKPDGAIAGQFVVDQFAATLKRVDLMETEDRERAAGYLLERWYILGFREPTGLFRYGSYFKIPEGYGEPLPPGWSAPDRPRL